MIKCKCLIDGTFRQYWVTGDRIHWQAFEANGEYIGCSDIFDKDYAEDLLMGITGDDFPIIDKFPWET